VEVLYAADSKVTELITAFYLGGKYSSGGGLKAGSELNGASCPINNGVRGLN
jgi:hypothetical protein